MNSQLQKQLLIGGLAGLLLAILIVFFLQGMRDELKGLKVANEGLRAEVAKGYALKANYEKLKAEVAEQEKVIEELIKIMPTDADRGELPYRIKKLADTAGIEQVSFSLQGPQAKDYYTEYPVAFTFKAGYHSLGQFASLISGYEKIINLSDLTMKREGGNSLYPISVTCRVSAFVYNPNSGQAAPAPAKAPAPAPKPSKKETGD
ncbi:MAG TPA: type 4a pilus biogenesis protein PilO [Holophaga sp.]|nr:type 4a pilus biogenesis protein PilO [Holophaga sp.]